MQKTKREKKNTWLGFLISIAVLVVLIILVVVFSENSDRTPEEASTETEEVVGNAALPMNPYEDGQFVYEFDDINWMFTDVSEPGVGVQATQVNFEFEQFSRRDGSYVNFARPYKTQTFKGECSELRRLEFDADQYGRPLSYAQCVWQDETTDIAIFQNNNNIVINYRTYTSDEISEFSELYAIDLTTMVR